MMWKRVRLLPVTILAAIMVFAFKMTAMVDTAGDTLPQDVAVAAEVDGNEDTNSENDDTGETAADDAGSGDRDGGVGSLVGRDPSTFTATEITLLENLAERREQMERHAAELDVRENLLVATENRIDEKIQALKNLEGRIAKLVEEFKRTEDARIKRLVKVYETMKPKDAARIFDQLQLDTLLDVVSLMKESKTALILAAMESRRARELTLALAQRTDLEGRTR